MRSPGAYERSARSTAGARANQAALLSRQVAAEAAKKGKAARAGKKKSPWATYQTLLVRRPFAMNMATSGIISAAGNLTQQKLLSSSEFNLQALIKGTLVATLLIAPAVHYWLGYLRKKKFHWVVGAAADQFIFSPLLNLCIFWTFALIAGGVQFSYPSSAELADAATPLTVSLSLYRGMFPSVWNYAPIWSTQITAYKLWIPAVLAREKLVPPHLAPVYSNLVGFVWNIILAGIMAGS